jgi:hypothetical protein
MDEKQPTRREVIKTALYAAPVILTLAATPSFSRAGSGGGRTKHWPPPDADDPPGSTSDTDD